MGVFAYYDADTNGTVYHVVPSPESEFAPSSFSSGVTSAATGATIQSDEIPGYFVLHHGRQQPAGNNTARWYPPDNIRRYVLRYLVSRYVFGGDYVGPVREMLSPIDGRERQALELGTRSGTWIQAMANQFPHVKFRSLDVVPMIAHVPRPNVVFEVYDFTNGLMVEDESQDVVFLNALLEMIKDYRSLLREVYRVLRPGGLIYISDFNPHFWDNEDITTPNYRTNPQGCHLFDIVRQHISSIGIDPDTCDKLPEWLKPGSNLWDDRQRGFGDIESHIRTYPAYPHEGFSCMDRLDVRIAPYVKHLCVQSWQDGIGLLKDAGIEETEAKRLTDALLRGLEQHDRCGLIKLYRIYAIKV